MSGETISLSELRNLSEKIKKIHVDKTQSDRITLALTSTFIKLYNKILSMREIPRENQGACICHTAHYNAAVESRSEKAHKIMLDLYNFFKNSEHHFSDDIQNLFPKI